MAARMSSKARCWVGVGRVILSKVWPPWVMVSRVRVAMCLIRPRKSRMGLASGSVGWGFWAGGLGDFGGGDGVVAGGWGLVGVGQGCQGAAPVPDEVGGEHADEDVGWPGR